MKIIVFRVAILLAFFAFLTPFSGWGQTTLQKSFGGTSLELARSFLNTQDGGYLMVGNTASYGGGNDDAIVIKVDSIGNRQWSRVLGGSQRDWGYDAIEVNGGYIICGNDESYGTSGQDFIAFRLDYAGNMVWTQTYGGTGQEYARFITLLEDSTFLLVGYTTTGTFGANDYLIVRANPANGNQIYSRRYGGTSNDFPHTILPLPGARHVMVGYRRDYPSSPRRGMWTLHDSSGTLFRQVEYGINNKSLVFNDAVPNGRGGYVIVGLSRNLSYTLGSGQALVLEIDSMGVVTWGKEFGGSAEDQALNIIAHPTNGYLISGVTQSISLNQDAFIMHIDTVGNLLWQSNHGGSGVEAPAYSHAVRPVPTGGYAFFHNSASIGAGGGDFVFSRLDNSGMLDGCMVDTSRFNNYTVLVNSYPTGMQTGVATYGATINPLSTLITPDTSLLCCPIPIADFLPNTGCAGTPTSFSNNSSNILPGAMYYWDLDGNGTVDDSSATPAAFTYAAPGVYNVSLVVNNACGSTDTMVQSVTVPGSATVNLGQDTSICAGDTLLLDAQNTGATYLWSDASTGQTLPATTAGTYIVTVTYSPVCRDTDTLNLSINALPTVNLGPDVAICLPNSQTFDAGNPGSTYLWSNAATTQTITTQTAGNYSVTVTNGNGCEAVDTVALQVFPALPVSLGPDLSTCAGTPVTLDAGFLAGGSYFWSTGATTQTISVSSSGNYWVIVTSPPGCSGSDTAQVTVNPLPTVSLGPDQDLCDGETTTLVPSGSAGSYVWSDGSTGSTLTTGTGGPHAVTLTDINGCTRSDTMNINIIPAPSVNLGPDQSHCEGASITLDAGNPGSVYSWSNGQSTQTIPVINSGTYGVTVTYGNGCEDADEINVNFSPIPVVNLGPDRAVCQGEFITFSNPVAGGTYQWSSGQTASAITVYNSGQYALTVTIPPGCSASDTVNFTVNQPPVFDLGPDFNLCEGDTQQIGGNLPPGNNLWSDGSSGNSIWVTDGNLYWLRIIDANGCQTVDSVYVTEIPDLAFDLGPDTTFCSVDEWKLSVNLPPADLLWNNGQTGNSILADASGSYYLTAENACFIRSDTIQLTFEGIQYGPFIPNAFTPNGDGLNDILEIVGSVLDEFEIQIFDRWGKMVFFGNQMSTWDGKIEGIDAPEGVYVWQLSYIRCDGVNETVSGSVTLVR